MARPALAEAEPIAAGDPLQAQITNHADEPGVGARGRGPLHPDSKLIACLLSLAIEIKEDFHMIGSKTDWTDDYISRAALVL